MTIPDTKLKPMIIPGKVEPMNFDEIQLSGMVPGEKFLLDVYVGQSISFGGTSLDFFSLSMRTTKADLLYGEAKEKVWVGPYKMSSLVSWPEFKSELKEEGWKSSAETKSWIARQEFDEKRIPYPKMGDLIRFWNVPYFNDRNDAEGYFFNVVNVNDKAHVYANQSFTGFGLTLTRDTEFGGERRVLDPINNKDHK